MLRVVVYRRDVHVDGVLASGKDSGEMSRWLLLVNLREQSEKEGQSAGRHVANLSFKVLDNVNESNKPYVLIISDTAASPLHPHSPPTNIRRLKAIIPTMVPRPRVVHFAIIQRLRWAGSIPLFIQQIRVVFGRDQDGSLEENPRHSFRARRARE